MNNNLLISAKYKVLGWILSLVFGLLGLLCLVYDFEFNFLSYNKDDLNGIFDNNNFTNEVALSGTIAGLLIIVFSKQKIEDEYISLLRLKSLQLSVFISYIAFIGINFCFYGLAFYNIIFYNSFTILIVFIITFQWKLFNLNKEGLKNEE
jgi:hypothetical protein